MPRFTDEPIACLLWRSGVSHLAEKRLPYTHADKSFQGGPYGDIHKIRWILWPRKIHHGPLFDRDFFWVTIPSGVDLTTQVSKRPWAKALHVQGKQPMSPASWTP